MRSAVGAIYIEDASRRVMAAAALVRVLRQGSQEDWERAVQLLAHMSACERAVTWVQFMDNAAKDGSLASAMVQYEQCRFVFDMVLKDVSAKQPVAAVGDPGNENASYTDSRGSSLYEASIDASDRNEETFLPSPYVLPPIPRPRPQSAPAHQHQGGPPTIARREGESVADYARRVLEDHEPRSDMSTPPHTPVPLWFPPPPPPRPPQDDRPPSARVRENMEIIEEDVRDQELPVHQGWGPVPWRQRGAGV